MQSAKPTDFQLVLSTNTTLCKTASLSSLTPAIMLSQLFSKPYTTKHNDIVMGIYMPDLCPELRYPLFHAGLFLLYALWTPLMRLVLTDIATNLAPT